MIESSIATQVTGIRRHDLRGKKTCRIRGSAIDGFHLIFIPGEELSAACKPLSNTQTSKSQNFTERCNRPHL